MQDRWNTSTSLAGHDVGAKPRIFTRHGDAESKQEASKRPPKTSGSLLCLGPSA